MCILMQFAMTYGGRPGRVHRLEFRLQYARVTDAFCVAYKSQSTFDSGVLAELRIFLI